MQVEQPYQGRAHIEENLNELRITIPARKRNGALVMLVILFVILIGVLGLASIQFLPTLATKQGAFFIFIMILLFAIFFIQGLRAFIWAIAGSEIIYLDKNYLSIIWTGSIFPYRKVYDIKEVRNIREEQKNLYKDAKYIIRNANSPMFRPELPRKSEGIIFFDYGRKLVNFGQGIDVTEARYIVSKIQTFLKPINSTDSYN